MRGPKFKPGGINGQSAKLTAPPSIGVEESLFRTIPVSFAAGTCGPRLPNALPLSYAGFHQRPDSNRRPLVPM